MLKLVLLAITVLYCTAQQEFVGRHATPHLREISRRTDAPFPHSETFQSYDDNRPRDCERATSEPYRRADGSCNNLRSPFQGAALDTQARLFGNSYVDKSRFPRIYDVNFAELPSARAVSLQCFDEEEDTDGNGLNAGATQLVWQWGQLLAHDITHVEKVDGSEHCCDDFDRSNPNRALFHPDENLCYPMEIPDGDPLFSDSCMIFSRSFGVDVFGVREPINAVTSYIDASVVYGSSQFLQDSIRTGVKGLLRTEVIDGQEQLPSSSLYPCERPASSRPCAFGGDVRVSDQPGLAAMHTLLHLEHNRLARGLSQVNPHWDDERLFQEARKILIAIEQKIVYEDYLPLIVGNGVMRRFGLRDDFVYDESVDARAILDFTTTGLRFGHTLVNSILEGDNLSNQFLRPINTEATNQRFKTLPFFQAANQAHEFNNLFTSELRGNLFKGITIPGFSPAPGPSLDLPALNIQRGREHGIAPYTIVRDTCLDMMRNLNGVRNETPSCFSSGIYSSVDEIDLFVGGVSETPLDNAILGTTFACMAGIQFQRLRNGDRYFYESTGVGGLTEDQMQLIKGTTLSSLICELNPSATLQRDAFRPATNAGSNRLFPCTTILEARDLDLHLHAWEEDPQTGGVQVQFV